MTGTRVTAIEADPPSGAQPEETVIENHYVLITDGTAHVHGVTVHNLKDGTTTHVITVKGCQP